MSHFISIIIPLYNVETYIADCLQSVMRQNYKGPMECIVVDDCGTDDSIAIAERMIADYSGPIEFRIIHHEHNRGISAARNTGMYSAKGDYAFFLDSDDWISDDCIEKLAGPLQTESVDFVVGDYKTNGELSSVLDLSLPEGKYQTKGIDYTFCNKGVYVMPWNKLFSKSFMTRNNLTYEEGKVHEDEIMAFELSCIDKTFFVVKAVTYFYRVRENSIVTQTDILKKLRGYIGVLNAVKDRMERYKGINGIYDFYMHLVKRCFSWIAKVEMDEKMLAFVDKETDRFLNPVPHVGCLNNKHNRLVYFACRKEQTYSRYQYVIKEIANQFQGRVLRNLLNMIPSRK